MYNRKERRETEKKLGLFRELSKMSRSQRDEVKFNKRRAGEQIHLSNVQELENKKIQDEAELYAKTLQSLIESGKTYEEAETVVKRNTELEEARRKKLSERREKQNNQSSSSVNKNN